MTDLTPLTRFAARGTLWPGVRGWHVTHGDDKRIPDDELISKIKHALSRALVPVL